MLVNRSGTMVIPFLTVYLVQKGFTLGEAGFVMALFGCGAILGGYIGGKASDKFGYFYVQVLSLLFNGALFIALGFMQQLWQISLCIFALSSVGDAFRPATSLAVAAYSQEQNRTRCYSLIRLSTNLGWAIGPAVGGLLASRSYLYLFWVDGITCMAASLLLYLLLFRHQQNTLLRKNTIGNATNHSAYKNKVYLKGLLLILLISVCFFQLFCIIPVYYKDVVHLPEKTIGWVLGVNGAIRALIEMVLVYKLENRRDGMFYMMIGAFLVGASFLVLTVSPTYIFVLISILTITVGEMFLFPYTNAFWVAQSTENSRGQYAALYTITFALAQVAAPTFAAQIAQRAGFSALFTIDFCICLVAVGGFYFLRKQLLTNE